MNSESFNQNKSDKSFVITLVLCIFFGFLGVHRFYAQKVGTGLVWLFTAGLFGVGYVVDIILITSQTFVDKQNKLITI